MLVISCLSQKGGVGKSTLARLIAWTYAGSDWEVKIADFNTKQKTSVDWVAVRLKQGIKPTIAAEPYDDIKLALKYHGDLLVIDGLPDSGKDTLQMARTSNLIVIPTSVTFDDLKPQLEFANELKSRGIDPKNLLFVINMTGDSEAALADARAFIEPWGFRVAKTDLYRRVGYQSAQNQGYSIAETAYATLNERAKALAQEIVDAATQITEKGAA